MLCSLPSAAGPFILSYRPECPAVAGSLFSTSQHLNRSTSSFSLSIQRALHPDPRLIQDMGVDHRGTHIFVPEEYLHAANVVAGALRLRLPIEENEAPNPSQIGFFGS